ncbi:MAG: 16S rRNA (cytosine(1402)-N(4))-methyltransferase RsmH [Desulfobacterales bacterium]|nr:16S rRNA (cytosine(1402)-N(4))-methyltransferase RsmH [Desulfobacterales bacterium]
MPYHHISAMPEEVARFLDCRPGQCVVDCTLGGAGHAADICRKITPGGTFIGIDQDTDAIRNAENVLPTQTIRRHLVHANFSRLPAILQDLEIAGVDGILMDLGISLHHIEGSGRGFSFRKNEPLDMRMDPDSSLTARDIINTQSEKALKKLFFRLGEERLSGPIARKIVAERARGPIEKADHLANIIKAAVPAAVSAKRIHPATRVFMALRIAVNRELDHLETFMARVPEMLNPGGRICILSFHSLEDRIVKTQLKTHAFPCTCPPKLPVCSCGKKPLLRLLTRKVVRPSAKEVNQNPMARSTRLRAAQRL